MIREIQIENFKSIPSLKLELGRFNVFIGSNGSGKSNILEAITLAISVNEVKLTNEFLSTRGIRMTEPSLMQSAFEKANFDNDIKIQFINDKNESVSYSIKWHDHIHEWRDAYLVDVENLIGSESTTELNVLNEGNTDYRKTIPKSGKDLAIEREFGYQEKKIATNKFLIENSLSNFLIFAPENYFLRNFTENQIKPLGIRGEGLFEHLAAISLKKPEILESVKESLKLIEWFEDLEFDRAADGYFTGRIKIKDIYLEEGIKYFDQKSANEGFLYLLFYLTLFISDDTPKFFAIDNVDNSLNPKLASDLMKVLADLAEKHDKQVIFTTHNPAILDGLNLNDTEQRLFVISRNAIGHTKAVRIENKPVPSNGKSIKLSEHFLRGNIGGLNF